MPTLLIFAHSRRVKRDVATRAPEPRRSDFDGKARFSLTRDALALLQGSRTTGDAPMASDWIKLTDRDNGEAIFVNMANALTVQRGSKCSLIWLPTGVDDESTLEVAETPEQIFELLRQSRSS